MLLALGLLVNLLILLVSGSRPHLDRHGLVVLLVWTIPGVLLDIGLAVPSDGHANIRSSWTGSR